MTGLDTLGAAKKLEAAGMPVPQAEAVVELIRDVRAAALSELVTKGDLAAAMAGLRADLTTGLGDLRSDLRDLRSDLRDEISRLRSDTAKWVIAAVMVNVLAVIGAMIGLAMLLGRIPKVP
jgi:predicted Zn-dependent peptidase